MQERSNDGYVLSIDVGTTSIRAHLFDKDAKLVANKSEMIPLIFPEPNHIEQDPKLLWKQCVSVIRQAIQEKNCSVSDVRCIGKTSKED
jgi:glycerol kinase